VTDAGERRRAPRVDLVGQIRGELVSMSLPIRVREISIGGLSMETTEPFTVNSRHEFMLTLGDGAGVFVLGRVAYCRAEDRPDGKVFISGIQFLDEDPSTAGDVSGLVKNVQ
jgi:hypothetical protein